MEKKQNKNNHDTDLLPRDIDAEKALLGGLLLEGDSLADIRNLLDVDDFSLEAHRRIYRAMLEQLDEGGHVDRITVGFRLRDAGHLQSVGGLDYICSLDEGMATVFGLEDYCKRVRAKSVSRRAILTLSKHIEDLQLYGDNEGVLEQIEQQVKGLKIDSIGKAVQMKTAEEYIQELGGMDKLFSSSGAHVPTPWSTLSHILSGGFRNGQLIILAARTGIGKTSTALQFVECAAKHEIPSAFFSLEMGTQELIIRLACGRAAVDASNIHRPGALDAAQIRRLNLATSEIARLPIYYDDTPGATLTMIESAMRQFSDKSPLGFAVVDYLQLVESPGRYENRNAAVSAVSRGMKKLAKSMKLPMLVLSQLKRLENEDKEPNLSDLRDSGAIEQDADVVLFLHGKSKQYGPTRDTNMIVAKQRNGPTTVIPMLFRRSTTRLELATDGTPYD